MPELTDLTQEELAALSRAARALEALAATEHGAALVATASARSLADLLLNNGNVLQDIVDVINLEWRATPFEIVRRKAS